MEFTQRLPPPTKRIAQWVATEERTDALTVMVESAALFGINCNPYAFADAVVPTIDFSPHARDA